MATYRVFSKKILDKVSRIKLTEADVKPQLVYNHYKEKAFWRPGRLSLRRQNDLRKACIQQGIQPESIGLPAVKEHKPLRYKPNKLEKHERMRAEREETIRKNMENMPKTIQAWKEDKMKEEAKLKKSMPF
ncbi:hypothetical protein BDF20DRAFT_822026 [Mycotypha africana]|uniref:uncharacterized protein n=1 Tax=Mycotypha africana TaxID=64632 RepID=UPI002300B76F|nr:uncharacterized protein BDF20DRAFT_822026 [Mycotypha africana]KAI8975260.1 hypothetical protein BDF20DRAFT_822026 [Mycotypha africana]